MVEQEPEPGATAGERRRWRGKGATALAIVVSVTVLVTGSVFAFVAANEHDGAATPAGAVEQMVAAVEAGDLLGILDALPPGERQVLAAAAGPLDEQLRRLGLLGRPLAEGPPSVAATVDDLALRTEGLDLDHARVTTTAGTLEVSWAGGSAVTPALQAVLQDDLGVALPPGGTYRRDLAQDPVTLVTLRDGGGWHVSLGYTVAESLRPEPGPGPLADQGPVAWGGDTPEEAVADLYRAGAALDVERAVAIMAPRESRALYDYAPLFLPDLQAAALARRQDDGYRADVADVQVRVEGSGSERKATVTRLAMTTQGPQERVELTYDGSCTERAVTTFADLNAPGAGAAGPPTTGRTCDGELVSAPPDDGEDQQARDRADPFRLQHLWYWRLGRGAPTFWLTERDGRWYVSPTRTLLATLTDALAAADPAQVEELAARLASLHELYLVPEERPAGEAGGPGQPG